MRVPELLAPAGNAVALHAAVRAGADAVYLGLDAFNARRNADNFTRENLAKACAYAHLRGVLIYVTMNTLILPEELDEAIECARQAYRAGVDAFIVQDVGLCVELARALPQAEIHASTQMNIHSEGGVRAAAELGVSRITLARELSLEEIAYLCDIAQEVGVQIETFAHGALCVCYSGQCLMSSMIGGRSANRGLCAQACRLPYELVNPEHPDKTLRAPGEFLLSPKDLCSVDQLQALTNAGVASLKIEGRMKSPEYVFAVVSVYRRVLDRLAKRGASSEEPAVRATESERAMLASVFSRGFSEAYLVGERSNEMMSYQRPNNRGQFIGRVRAVDKHEVRISCERPLVSGDVLEVWTRRSRVTLVVPEQAMKHSKTAVIPLADVANAAHIRATDRVFRVRSAEAAFVDDDHLPRIPVVGQIRLVKGQPLDISFQVATPEQVAQQDMSAGGEKDNGESLQESKNSISGSIVRRLQAQSNQRNQCGQSEGPLVEEARTKAITADEVRAHVDRLGATPFELLDLEVILDEGVGIGFSQLHRQRTAALEALERQVLLPWEDRHLERAAVRSRLPKAHGSALQVAVVATNPECARAAKRAGADLIYVPALTYRRGQSQTQGCLDRAIAQAGFPKQSIIMMPSIDHDAVGCAREAALSHQVWDYAQPGQPLFVESLGSLATALERGALPEVGPQLPLVNKAALELAAAFDVARVWLSPELTLRQIEQLAKSSPVPLGIKVAGAQELMVTEHCLLMSQGACSQECLTCSRRTVPHALRDRKGYEFRVISDAFGRSHLMNSVELDTVPALPDLAKAGVSAFMLDATLMNAEQTAQATGRLVKALKMYEHGSAPEPKLPHTTSGHLFRGVS